MKENKIDMKEMLRKEMERFAKEEAGMGVVEIILIIVVLVSIAIIFQDQITELVENIWDSINRSAKKIY